MGTAPLFPSLKGVAHVWSCPGGEGRTLAWGLPPLFPSLKGVAYVWSCPGGEEPGMGTAPLVPISKGLRTRVELSWWRRKELAWGLPPCPLL